jgi:two-component system phosphate regulon sensor histidine kinase PhoR
MRWWLGLAFALIAGLTALSVALVFSQRAGTAFEERSDVLALGNAVVAAEAVKRAYAEGTQADELGEIALERELSLFVFDAEGTLTGSSMYRALTLDFVPDQEEAVQTALAGDRYVATLEDGSATIVALPVSGLPEVAAVLAYVPQPEYAASIGIFQREIVVAALVAVPIGALVGLLVAVLIAARLRRVANAAAAIEAGNFDLEVKPKFRDEVGALGLSIDQMRVRLQQTFARLQSEHDRLQQLLERLRDGVVMVDPALQVEYVNRAAQNALGQGRIVEGEPLPDLWRDLSLRRIAAGLFRPGAQVAQARISPDEDRTFAVVGIPAGPDGESAVIVLTDISEQERRERAEREFVTNAAHELRTPLAAITGAVEVLQGGAKEVPEERDRFLGNIERESARLGRLARALLVLARAQTRQEAPRLAPVRLRPLLEDVAAGMAPRKGVEVRIVCPSELEALTETDLIEQVVANLAANAVKHTELGVVTLAAEETAGGVVVEVRDSGPGILPHDQERVFDRFYRGGDRNSEGFGLGLSIVRHAVRALGGAVEVDSTPGRGTRVRVTLPAVVRRHDRVPAAAR